MASISFQDIADVVLNKRTVHGLNIDSQLREVAARLSARAFIELINSVPTDAEFAQVLPEILKNLPPDQSGYFIGFCEGDGEMDETNEEGSDSTEPEFSCYLRLVFANDDAAFYQFPVFPNLDASYICSAGRKRVGNVQHIRLDLTTPNALQRFIEDCRRRNPHLVRVEESTAEEFMRATSNAI